MKIAQYQNIQYPYITTIAEDIHGEYLVKNCGYARLSDYIEVEFPPVTDKNNISEQLAALEGQREKIAKKYDSELASIDERKAQLQANLTVGAAA